MSGVRTSCLTAPTRSIILIPSGLHTIKFPGSPSRRLSHESKTNLDPPDPRCFLPADSPWEIFQTMLFFFQSENLIGPLRLSGPSAGRGWFSLWVKNRNFSVIVSNFLPSFNGVMVLILILSCFHLHLNSILFTCYSPCVTWGSSLTGSPSPQALTSLWFYVLQVDCDRSSWTVSFSWAQKNLQLHHRKYRMHLSVLLVFKMWLNW